MNFQRNSTSRGSVVFMAASRGGNDEEAAVTVQLELALLDRLIYKNRSQHRSTKYFSLLLEVKRTSRVFAAQKIPYLLAEEIDSLRSIPGKRDGQAREAWVRDASFKLRRSRSAVVTCAATLEAIVKVSRHLAHQVSQSYFLALSVTLLACISRIFSCSLHLGGRLLGVHGALLRSMLAHPCSSDCLSASVLVACRLPEEEVRFLELLRRAGGGSPGTNKSGSSSAQATMSDSIAMYGEQANLTRSHGDNVDGIGDPGAVGNAKTDDDDIGELVNHNVMMADDEEELTRNFSFVPTPSVDALMPSSGGEGGTRPWTRADKEAWAKVGVSDKFATVQSREGEDTSGSDGGRILANAGQRSMTSRKKLVLAADFSDSSSDEDGDEDNSRESPSLKPESMESTSAEKPRLKRSSDPSEINSSSLGKQSLRLQGTQRSNAASIARPSSRGSNGDDRINSKGVPTYDDTKTQSSPFGAVVGVLFDAGPPSSLSSNEADRLSNIKSLSGGPLGETGEDRTLEMVLQRCEPVSAPTERAKEGTSEKGTSRLDVKSSKKTSQVKRAKPGNPVSSHQKIRSGGGKGGMMKRQVTQTPLENCFPYTASESIPDEHATPPAKTGGVMTPLRRQCARELVASPQDGTGHDAGAPSVTPRGKQNPREKDSHGVKRQSTEKAQSGKRKNRRGTKSSKTKAKGYDIIENIFGSL